MSIINIIRERAGIELVRHLATEGCRIFTMGQAKELASTIGLSYGYLRQVLHHLAKTGWVIRLRKGLYALAPTVPGIAPVHEFEIAMHLVQPAAIACWSALHYHGLTDQAPRKVFVMTTTECALPRLRGVTARPAREGYQIAETTYQFIQLKPERFFGMEKVWIDEARVVVTDPERTLLDGLAMPHYCGDFAEVLHAFTVCGRALKIERIIEYALQLDDATVKRLGWVLEQHGVAKKWLERLARVPIKGYRTLDPTGPRKGPYNRYWMIQENLPGRVNE